MKRFILPVAAWMLAVRKGATEFGAPYHVKDTESVIAAIRGGAPLSSILGLEDCEHTKLIDYECQEALLCLKNHGLLTTLQDYSMGGLLNETASA